MCTLIILDKNIFREHTHYILSSSAPLWFLSLFDFLVFLHVVVYYGMAWKLGRAAMGHPMALRSLSILNKFMTV